MSSFLIKKSSAFVYSLVFKFMVYKIKFIDILDIELRQGIRMLGKICTDKTYIQLFLK